MKRTAILILSLSALAAAYLGDQVDFSWAAGCFTCGSAKP